MHRLLEAASAGKAERSALIDGKCPHTLGRLAPHAVEAPPAAAHERHDHMVARPQGVDIGSDVGDDARHFVTVNRRQVAAPRALNEADVAVADAACVDAHGNFARSRLGELDFLDHERMTKSVAHCGAHWVSNNARRCGFAT